MFIDGVQFRKPLMQYRFRSPHPPQAVPLPLNGKAKIKPNLFGTTHKKESPRTLLNLFLFFVKALFACVTPNSGNTIIIIIIITTIPIRIPSAWL